MEYSVEGAFADHLTFDNPLEGTLVLSRAVDYETLKTFEVVIVARDQGTPPMESRCWSNFFLEFCSYFIYCIG